MTAPLRFDDDRLDHDEFTIALATMLARRDGLDLGALRNFGETDLPGPNKYEYLRSAERFTEPFLGSKVVTPTELAEVWLSLPPKA
ncbi:hypothetical protein CcrC1_gp201 [Caulobacter phage C1]|nr:hypothetical protein CcrC1_gp201 [Caulobacter phage C1]UTU08430.1 hypothetical protein CcrC2_gp202 [Caulobacter phage C2]UTU08947.1 hypothetical protein CcrJ4_gp196 [Caulobacter phage J4]UTU09504.1 hypothetical protein CcrBL47_gp218 [Caulobacter phage BL47]UTU10063.1 hypothetical protein CcrRB23_gp201 [Caulobacter phage RB23]WGN97098.1 hypothetical protein [Bertelyvirus sp.]